LVIDVSEKVYGDDRVSRFLETLVTIYWTTRPHPTSVKTRSHIRTPSASVKCIAARNVSGNIFRKKGNGIVQLLVYLILLAECSQDTYDMKPYVLVIISEQAQLSQFNDELLSGWPRFDSGPQRPDRSWGLPSLLFIGYQGLFPGGKLAGV
jgi:hypothetical protein